MKENQIVTEPQMLWSMPAEVLSFFKANSTIIDGKWAYYPYWTEIVDEEACIVKIHHMDNLPMELHNLIRDFRLNLEETSFDRIKTAPLMPDQCFKTGAVVFTDWDHECALLTEYLGWTVDRMPAIRGRIDIDLDDFNIESAEYLLKLYDLTGLMFYKSTETDNTVKSKPQSFDEWKEFFNKKSKYICF